MDRRFFLAGAAAATAAPSVARAQAPAANPPAVAAPLPQAPGFFRFRVGEFVVTMVNDGTFFRPNALEGLFTNASAAEIQAALDAAGLPVRGLQNSVTLAFVAGPRGTVLLDAGTGGGQLTPQTGQMIRNMEAAGIRAEDVSLVCVSHYHPDHITGLTTREDRPFFPNAEIAVPAVEHAFWTDTGNEGRAPANQRGNFAIAARRLGPYAARTRRFEDGAELAPGLRAVAAPGHTPGHTAFHLSSGDAQLLVMGDAASRPELALRNPHWHLSFDIDGPLAVQTRRRLFDRAAADRTLVAGYHFNFPAAGRVFREGEGYRWQPAEWTPTV